MADVFYVVKESECSECKGWGVIQHPIWEKFYQNFPVNRPTAPDKVIESFWKDHGFEMDDRPDEEEKCTECNGTGKVIEQYDLRLALEKIAKG